MRTLIKVVALYVSASAQMFEREFAKIARRRHRNTDAVAGTTLRPRRCYTQVWVGSGGVRLEGEKRRGEYVGHDVA